MNKFIIVGLATSSLLASLMASAAQTADLTVTGTIEPASCTPTFPNGATIDYGNIAASSLKQDALNYLASKSTTLNITCNAPAKFYLSFVDNKSTTIPAGIGTTGSVYYGLGTTSKGGPIGAYTIGLNGATATAGSPRFLVSNDSGATWTASSGSTRSPGFRYAWGDGTTSLTPAAFSSITANVSVNAIIDKASNLPLADQTTLDGSATITLTVL